LKQYDAFGERKTLGITTTGVLRSTYLIDPAGTVKKKWHDIHAKARRRGVEVPS